MSSTAQGWAVVGANGEIQTDRIDQYSKHWTIRSFLADHPDGDPDDENWKASWHELKAQGYTVQRVEIRVLGDDG